MRFDERLRAGVKTTRGALLRRARPPRWHDLRRVEPIDRRFGMTRGTPVDRHYIEAFLSDRRSAVRGHVLEVGDDRYTTLFSGPGVTRSSVLHAEQGNSRADLVGDLSKGLPGHEGSFDCLILTQVLPFVFDLGAAVRTIRDLCRDGGTALVTLPGISQVSRYDMDRWGDFWRFTTRSASDLFENAFGKHQVEVVSYGNVLAAVSLLHGIAAEELTEDELRAFDADYPVIIGVVAHAVA